MARCMYAWFLEKQNLCLTGKEVVYKSNKVEYYEDIFAFMCFSYGVCGKNMIKYI